MDAINVPISYIETKCNGGALGRLEDKKQHGTDTFVLFLNSKVKTIKTVD